MYKNKRTFISILVSLTVFCISAIFYQPDSLSPAMKEVRQVTKVGVSDPGATASDTEDIEIHSFSYGPNTLPSVYNATVVPSDTNADTDVQEILSVTSAPSQIPDTTEITSLSITPVPEQKPSTIPDKSSKIGTDREQQIQSESLYGNIGISAADDYVNIRKEASTEAEVLGKLYKGSAATILKTKGQWCYVESGSVKGYIKAEFLKTGISDDELIAKYGELRIMVDVDGLNVRETTDTESAKLDVIYKNEVYPVLDTKGDWIKIKIEDDNVTGYVKKEFTELIVSFKEAVSKEEEQELLKLQAEEQAKKETQIKQQDGVSYCSEDLMLLACLVHAEAGTQSYEGKLAVANVVLNRVKSSKYPDSIKAVIYQSGQFSVARSGSLAKQLDCYANYNSNYQKLSIKAAKAALEGANNIGSRLYFHSYKAAVNKGYDEKENAVKIGDQLFW